MVCVNVSGSHKISCALIGKADCPACIKNRVRPIPFFTQNIAWMDKEKCWKSFHEVFVLEGRRRTGRRVLLIMDDALGHFKALRRKTSKQYFFLQVVQVGNHHVIKVLLQL
jgi:hypothetical protein